MAGDDKPQSTVANLEKRDLGRREYIAVASTLGGTVLAGCTGGDDSSGTSTQSSDSSDGGGTEASSTSSSGDDKANFVIGSSADVQNLDPQLTTAASSFQVLENTQERLFNITSDLEIVPQLATGLETSEDLKTWTIPIRKGVKFHPPVDRELVAQDFVYTFERIMDEDVGSPRSYYFDTVESVSAPDDYTLKITLSEAAVSQKVYLASSGTGVIPKEAVEEFGGDLKQHPVGTGPFVFDEWVSGSHTRIKKFEDYWRDDVPSFESVTFNVIPKGKVRVTELQTGEAEFLPSAPAEHLDELRNSSEQTLGETESPGFNYVGVNCGRSPLDKKKVRQAISEAIDRKSVVQAATFGTGQPTQNPFPSSSPWHVDYNPYSTGANPEKAKQLLSEAGVSTPVEITITTDNKYEDHTKSAKVVQANLNQAGFNASIDLYDWGTFLQREHEEKYDVYVNSWTGFIDPDTYLYPMFRSDGGFNWLNYSNENLDSLLAEGRTETDDKRRKEIYEKAQKLVVDEAPYVWMFHSKVIEAWDNNIKGHKPHPLSHIELDSMHEE
jgi:peptide/nickel transport system substrate-binding protein